MKLLCFMMDIPHSIWILKFNLMHHFVVTLIYALVFFSDDCDHTCSAYCIFLRDVRQVGHLYTIHVTQLSLSLKKNCKLKKNM